MKTNISLLILVIVLLALSFTAGRCSKKCNTENIIVKIPEVIGTFDTIKNPIPLEMGVKDSIIYKDSIIFHDREFDKEMVLKYSQLESEYDKLKAMIKAAEINYYSIPLENEFIKTVNNVKVQGRLIDFQQDFIIKEREITVPVLTEKRIFALYSGIGLKTTTLLDEIQPTANIILQNKKGNLLSLQYGLDESIQLSYSFKVFEIKR